MSMGYRGKTTNATRETVAVQAQSERESMWGEISGTIVDFDPSNQTATIQPDYKPIHNGQPVDMPQLLEVPVRFPRAGGFIITQPIKAGDKVTLRPRMRATDDYLTGGEFTPDHDTRSFSLSDMEAFLDGGEPLTKPISSFNNENMEIRGESGLPKIEIAESGMILLKISDSSYIELSSNGIKIVAPRVDFNP